MALVFAMGGSAVAARHYLVTSTNQIKPSVLKSLKGNAGPKGATGLQGVQGKEGAVGKEGAAGKEGKEGARGPSNGYQAFKDEAALEFSGKTTLGELSVPAGSYLASAKVAVKNTSSTEEVLAVCQLTNDVNGDSDQSGVALPKKGVEWNAVATVSLEAASTLSAAGHWVVSCLPVGGPKISAGDLKIQAVRVESLSNSKA